MIRPQLTPDGRAVRLPVAQRVDPLLDDLATAYAEDPDALGVLLTAHAEAVAAYDHAEASPLATDYGRAMRAAEADGTREALLAECPSGSQLDDTLTPREAIRLADDLTARAARAHLAQNRNHT
ncbi:hypothetical protein ACGH2B_12370 [Streptomyces sp. BBFR2]|uniref:hypothetical protein n=1 Tax=Streptomyces sp. BBFR2 TaxID=3372854 RepID=UPI0037DA33BE